jgi:hypothetical protein
MDEAWVKSIRRQCDAAHVPFFFKQWGGVRKSQAGRQLEGRTYDDMPPADIASGARASKAACDDCQTNSRYWLLPRNECIQYG